MHEKLFWNSDMPATTLPANQAPNVAPPLATPGQLGFFYRIGLTARRIFPAIADLASNEVYVLASAIAFNALLALYPFLLLVLLTCREVLHWNTGVETTLFLLKTTYLPVAEDFIVRNLRVVLEEHTNRGVAVFSIVALIFTSAGIFTPLELALNRAWRVRQPRSGWKSQLLAMGLVPVCGVCFLLIVALTVGMQWLATQMTRQCRNAAPGILHDACRGQGAVPAHHHQHAFRAVHDPAE
jgi:membrane protein